MIAGALTVGGLLSGCRKSPVALEGKFSPVVTVLAFWRTDSDLD